MRCRAADRIERVAADEQVKIGAFRFKWIVCRRAECSAALPPAVLAHYHARIEVRVKMGADAHAALRRVNRDPVALGNPSRPCCFRVQFHFWVEGFPAQAGQGAMLALAEQGGLGTVSTSGKRLARSGRATGPIAGSTKSGSGA